MNKFVIAQASTEITAAAMLIESYVDASVYGIREFKESNLGSMVDALEDATVKLKEQLV